jgi:hypothetical protein
MPTPSKSWLLLSFCLSAFATASAFGAATCTTDQSLTVPPSKPLEKVKRAYQQSDGSIVILGSLTVDADGAPRLMVPRIVGSMLSRTGDIGVIGGREGYVRPT